MLYEVTIEVRALVEAPDEKAAEDFAAGHAWEMDGEIDAAHIHASPLRALGEYAGSLPWGGDGRTTADVLFAAQAKETP